MQKGGFKMQKLFTAEQAAEILQVKKSTIYDWVYRGKIRHVKLGKMLRFLEDDIKHLINSSIVEKSIAGIV